MRWECWRAFHFRLLQQSLESRTITEQTTMKELRENPSIKGSGFYTYCNEWIEGSTKYDNTPIKGYVSWAASEDAAEGMNLVIENYNKGVPGHMAGVYTGRDRGRPGAGHGAAVLFPGKNGKRQICGRGARQRRQHHGRAERGRIHREPAARSGAMRCSCCGTVRS